MAADPRLPREWHPDNSTSATQVARSSHTKYRWKCSKGHAPYEATCGNRCTHNNGCPAFGNSRKGPDRHPKLSVGRPDLADEWDAVRNDKLPDEVTLGSNYSAWWHGSNNPEHIWQALVKSRALSGSGCPKCRCRSNWFQECTFGSTQ